MIKVLTYLLIGLTLIFAEEALANQDKVSVKVATTTSIKKAKAMETWDGDKVSLWRIKKMYGKKHNMVEVLKRAQIELTSGDIVYPEEVRFVIVSKGFFRSKKERVPHSDDTTGNGGAKRAPPSDD
ncbi:MAG: hypothetical protein HN576_10955 [Bacteriovoracaceae bacterium]|jgi:hypothetical protein|nr:hypothetical protein [Bacteriovoracaceae bacterium]